MITRKIDSDGDWRFGNGKQNYANEQNSLMQNIKTRLLEFKGDCYFNIDAGVDWFHLMGSKSQDAVKNGIAKVIIQTIGVKKIDSLEVSLDDDRNLTISYTITSIWGETSSSLVTVG